MEERSWTIEGQLGCGCVLSMWETYDGRYHHDQTIEYCPEHAAAPALYKALQSAAEYFEMLENATGVEHPVLEEIRAAQALAEKEENNG